MEWLKGILDALIPPHGADTDAVYRWRVRVAISVLAFGALTMGNTFAILGLMPALFSNVGIVGEINTLKANQTQFVTKSDLMPLANGISAIQEGINQSRISELTTQLYNLRVLQCDSIKKGNIEAARSHDQQMQDLEFRWRLLTKYDYQRRPCSEL